VRGYVVNEIFYSLQGEGVRAGTPNLFLRLSRCNLACKVETHGFDCDTEFESGRSMALDDIVAELRQLSANCDWVILTGGEPALQVDAEMIDGLHAGGFKLAVETNGSIELPSGIDWITVSPKVAEHAIRQRESIGGSELAMAGSVGAADAGAHGGDQTLLVEGEKRTEESGTGRLVAQDARDVVPVEDLRELGKGLDEVVQDAVAFAPALRSRLRRRGRRSGSRCGDGDGAAVRRPGLGTPSSGCWPAWRRRRCRLNRSSSSRRKYRWGLRPLDGPAPSSALPSLQAGLRFCFHTPPYCRDGVLAAPAEADLDRRNGTEA
jgi:organic radical activating enzyme